MSPNLYWVAVALVTITSAARLTRLATVDRFPPVRWLRDKFEDATDGSDWQLLSLCGYCASFWLTMLVVLSGYFSDFHPVWWIVNGILGSSYLAAILMRYDGDTMDDMSGDR